MDKVKTYVIKMGDGYFHGVNGIEVNFYNSLQGSQTFDLKKVTEALDILKESGFTSVYKVRIKERHHKGAQ